MIDWIAIDLRLRVLDSGLGLVALRYRTLYAAASLRSFVCVDRRFVA